ncbi:MAG TPA: flavodoxin domain-containing protein [Methanocella sp.]|uniref:flavodoxin domain-containing protein n=1 Tax=Methanocella sp. TaxID=2052833 RepID=UPI002CCEC952|nr:flavodoxin domain-containing protein [Methanocella sp.]HTY89819.1 flavodoxin domain-containing protein [Methanocella sp.]
MWEVILVYVTKSGNTKLIAEAIAGGVRSMGLDAEAVSMCDIGVEEVLSSKVIGVGSPTYEHKMLSPIQKLLDRWENAGCDGKFGIAFGSYGWSGEAPLMIAERMRRLGFKVLDPVLRIQYRPNDKDIEACELLGKDIARKLKRSLIKI